MRKTHERLLGSFHWNLNITWERLHMDNRIPACNVTTSEINCYVVQQNILQDFTKFVTVTKRSVALVLQRDRT